MRTSCPNRERRNLNFFSCWQTSFHRKPEDFCPQRQDLEYHASKCWRVSVRPKSTSAHHHRRVRPSQDWGFLSLFTPLTRPTCFQMLATHWSSQKAQQHTTMDSIVDNLFDFWIYFLKRVRGSLISPSKRSNFALTTTQNTIRRRPTCKLAKWYTQTRKNLNTYPSMGYTNAEESEQLSLPGSPLGNIPFKDC